MSWEDLPQARKQMLINLFSSFATDEEHFPDERTATMWAIEAYATFKFLEEKKND